MWIIFIASLKYNRFVVIKRCGCGNGWVDQKTNGRMGLCTDWWAEPTNGLNVQMGIAQKIGGKVLS